MIIALAALAVTISEPEVVIVRGERLIERSDIAPTVTRDDLAGQTGLRLDEVVRIVPGVGLFRRTSSGAANATIQGLSLRPIAPNGAGRALVSLDGVPQNDPFGGWIYWSRYDPVFLDQVDVKRGGEGAGFGPMALTGTLDLTEARGEPAVLVARAGGQDALYLAGRQSLVTPGAVFTAMGAIESGDGGIPVKSSQRGLADIPIDFQAMSVSLVTDVTRDNGAWSFRGSGFAERKGSGLIGGQSQAFGIDASIARRFEGPWGQGRVLIYAQGREFSNQTVAVTTGRAATLPALDQFATPSSAIGGSLVYAPSYQQLVLPRVSLDWRIAEGQTRELFRFIGQGFTRSRIAGGAQDLVGIGLSFPRPVVIDALGLRFDGGLRLDYWGNRGGIRHESDRATALSTLDDRPPDKSGTVVTGRVSLAQTRGPLALSFYRTFRPPTLNELHRPFRVGNDVTEANSALVPETLLGLDFDIRANRVLREGLLTTSVTLYANQLQDPIANVTLGSGPGVFARVGFLPVGGSYRERRNVGRIDATGLEMRLDWQPVGNGLSWAIAASLTDARVEGGTLVPQLTGKRPAQSPNWSASANLIWPVTQTVKLSITGRGEGGRFEDDLNARELPAYGALDLRLAWRMGNKTELFITGENMLDTPIQTALAGDGVVSLAQPQTFWIGFKRGG
jgi:hypothetical protein